MFFLALLLWFIAVNVPVEIIRKYILKKGLWPVDEDSKQLKNN